MNRLSTFSVRTGRVAAPLIAAAVAGACSTLSGAPSSVLEDRHVLYPAILYRQPVVIVGIDGKSNTFPSPTVTAGTHDVTVSAPAVGLLTQPVEETFRLSIQPCLRYNVAAQRTSAFAQEFALVVERVDPAGGCTGTPGDPNAPVVLEGGRPVR